ncbi:hypothetical protein I553_10422, partial [Mycobacterium xenopi 4042]
MLTSNRSPDEWLAVMTDPCWPNPLSTGSPQQRMNSSSKDSPTAPP